METRAQYIRENTSIQIGEIKKRLIDGIEFEVVDKDSLGKKGDLFIKSKDNERESEWSNNWKDPRKYAAEIFEENFQIGGKENFRCRKL